MVRKNLLKTSLKIKIKENGRRILKPTLTKRIKKNGWKIYGRNEHIWKKMKKTRKELVTKQISKKKLNRIAPIPTPRISKRNK